MSNTCKDLSSLNLSLHELCEIRDAFTVEIERGLAEPEQQIRALPTYIARPRAGLRGQAIVVDTGGTNMRAALVEIDAAGDFHILRGPYKSSVPSGRDGQEVTASQFFLAQAELAARLNPPAGLPVGYCFSYPAESTPDCDARLLNWTKGLTVSGVVGTLVGKQLGQAMGQLGFAPSRVVVLNDTVAALLAGAGGQAEQYDNLIGLIAGTGTNMAGFVKVKQHSKTTALDFAFPDMAINLESGNFFPPHLTAWDDRLDAQMQSPGRQRFEKAVSGHYLPFLYHEVCPENVSFNPLLGTAQLVAMRDEQQDPAARAILERSGKLIASGLAGFINAMKDSHNIGVVAEGSLYWGDPQQNERVCTYLKQLLRPEQHFSIVRVDDANLLGCACAALA